MFAVLFCGGNKSRWTPCFLKSRQLQEQKMTIPTADRKTALITGISGQDGFVIMTLLFESCSWHPSHNVASSHHVSCRTSAFHRACCRSYLAELLLQKGYTVHGLSRRASTQQSSHLKAILATGERLTYGSSCIFVLAEAA